jgi:hypothetical protein
MALTDVEIGLDELKLVMVLVPRNQGHPLDPLILDELLASERTGTLHRGGRVSGRAGTGTRVATAELKPNFPTHSGARQFQGNACLVTSSSWNRRPRRRL